MPIEARGSGAWTPHRIVSAVLLGVLVGGGLYLLSLGGDPERLPPHTIPSGCVEGQYCPSRGLTRAFVCLLRGDLAGARHYNSAAPFLFVAFAAQGPLRLWMLRPCPPERVRRRAILDGTVSAALFGIGFGAMFLR